MSDRAEDVAHVVVRQRLLVPEAELVAVDEHALRLESFTIHLMSVERYASLTHEGTVAALQVLDPNLWLSLALLQLLDDGGLRLGRAVRCMQPERDDGVPVGHALLR